MSDVSEQIAANAAQVVRMAADMGFGKLDYSEASLEIVERMLASAANSGVAGSPEFNGLVAGFSCYVLEVARRLFPGTKIQWDPRKNQPVVVAGLPTFSVAIYAHDKVRGRLSGDPADNIPFHFAGFAERVRQAKAGDKVAFV